MHISIPLEKKCKTFRVKSISEHVAPHTINIATVNRCTKALNHKQKDWRQLIRVQVILNGS